MEVSSGPPGSASSRVRAGQRASAYRPVHAHPASCVVRLTERLTRPASSADVRGVRQSAFVATFVLRLAGPRPTFALDMSDDERELMGRHAAHWQRWIDGGQMVVFGPVLDSTGSWGLAVIESDDEDQVRAHAADDPVVTSGIGTMEVGTMLLGYIRPSTTD